MRIGKDLGANQIVVYNDSSVIAGHILGSNATKEDHLVSYQFKVQGIAQNF